VATNPKCRATASPRGSSAQRKSAVKSTGESTSAPVKNVVAMAASGLSRCSSDLLATV
jgi:hypothetical protein